MAGAGVLGFEVTDQLLVAGDCGLVSFDQRLVVGDAIQGALDRVVVLVLCGLVLLNGVLDESLVDLVADAEVDAVERDDDELPGVPDEHPCAAECNAHGLLEIPEGLAFVEEGAVFQHLFDVVLDLVVVIPEEDRDIGLVVAVHDAFGVALFGVL